MCEVAVFGFCFLFGKEWHSEAIENKEIKLDGRLPRITYEHAVAIVPRAPGEVPCERRDGEGIDAIIVAVARQMLGIGQSFASVPFRK